MGVVQCNLIIFDGFTNSRMDGLEMYFEWEMGKDSHHVCFDDNLKIKM